MSLRKSIGRIIGGESAEETARKSEVNMEIKQLDVKIAETQVKLSKLWKKKKELEESL